jgi:hypothetical protein
MVQHTHYTVLIHCTHTLQEENTGDQIIGALWFEKCSIVELKKKIVEDVASNSDRIYGVLQKKLVGSNAEEIIRRRTDIYTTALYLMSRGVLPEEREVVRSSPYLCLPTDSTAPRKAMICREMEGDEEGIDLFELHQDGRASKPGAVRVQYGCSVSMHHRAYTIEHAP